MTRELLTCNFASREQFKACEEGQHQPAKSKYKDLFDRIEQCKKKNPPGTFRVEWVKGHQGKATEGEETLKEGSDAVDEAARNAVKRHKQNEEIVKKAQEQQEGNEVTVHFQTFSPS